MLKKDLIKPIPIGTKVRGILTDSDKRIVNGIVVGNYSHLTLVRLETGFLRGIPTQSFYCKDGEFADGFVEIV